MTVIEHLEEFRYRLIVSLSAFIVGSAVAYTFYRHIFDLLTKPLDESNRISGITVEGLNVFGVTTAFLVRIRVSIFAGLVLALPVILYQLWRFVTPGLQAKEKRFAIPFVIGSLGLFSLGAVFAYLVLPQALGFLLGFAKGVATPLISVDQYLKFVTFMILAFGITFEFPMVLLFLAGAGVLSSARLRQYRRHAIVGCFIVGAVATPSQDPYSMTLMAVPLYILYEASLAIIRFVMKK